MGRLAKLLSFTRNIASGAKVSDVKFDQGGGANLTGHHFSSAGDDAYPLPNDFVVTVPVEKTGGFVVVGYIDPVVDQKAIAGDKRLYARDSTGAWIVELWLKSDGSCVIDNGSGSIELQANGTVVINTVIISTTGKITAGDFESPTAQIGGVEHAGHVHSNPEGGEVGPAKPPTPP